MCRQAKLDALSTLGECAQGWGGQALAQSCSMPAIWEGLRTELLAEADAVAEGQGDDVPAAALSSLAVPVVQCCLASVHFAAFCKTLPQKLSRSYLVAPFSVRLGLDAGQQAAA